MKSGVKKILTILLRPYFWLRTRYMVWCYILTRSPRQDFKKYDTAKNPLYDRIVKELKSDGVAFTSVEELFGGAISLEELQRYAGTLLPGAIVRKGKPFLKMLWLPNHAISLKNPFIRVALSDAILTIAGRYVGSMPKHYYTALEVTTPMTPGASEIRSQSWHRDPEDLRMCKMFLYLNDVDESRGPFIYLKGSHFDGPYRSVFPQQAPKGSYPDKKAVEKLIPVSQEKICVGKAGTIVFADTAGLHRGGYATGGERLMFTSDYSSRAALRAPLFSFADTFEAEKKSLSPLGQYAVERNVGTLLSVMNAITRVAIRYGLYDSDY